MAISKLKKKRGAPKREGPPLERVIFPFTREFLAEIDDVRFKRRLPSRAETVRTLLREAMAKDARRP